MLLCETARPGRLEAEDLAIFASQLAALGLPVRVPADAVPERPSLNLQFDLAPFLHDGDLGRHDRLVLVGADRLTDAALARLRRLAGETPVTALAFGAFGRPQTALGVRARLAYVLGREPALFDLGGGRAAPVFGVVRPVPRPDPVAPPRLLLVGPDLEDPAQAAVLRALAPRRGLRVSVVTDSKGKQAWIAANGRGVPVFAYGEALPLVLAERTDLAVFFGRIEGSYRLSVLAANLVAASLPVLDGSAGHVNAAVSDAFVPAPEGLVGLDGFLDAEILPNRARLGEHVAASRAAAAARPDRVLAFLAADDEPDAPARPPHRSTRPAPAAGGIVFMPTNGVGVGHARRCTLIARSLDGRRSAPVFAAFPSCTALIKAQGFDVMPLLGRSRLHAQSHEHDLANYLRLRALTAGARALVFDGGYVFDSIYRIALQPETAAVWVRRGLWPREQDNSIALDREKAFDRVIVPEEAFEELNTAYSRGPHVIPVGPVVQTVRLDDAARAALRADLAERYGRPFERLAVTLLGAGVAAARGTQVQALCGLFERRSDTLHLVVLWPNATLEPGWFGWDRSRVVRTRHAAILAAAADVAVTAAGYNSFHEALYNRVAAIFVPQTAGFMDDQRARARAAVERGLAAMADAHELMTLERLVGRYLDDGEGQAVRARLAAADLPAPGTARAAALIEETAYGQDAVELDPAQDRPA